MLASESPFDEDLPQLAVEAFHLADRLCGTCRDYHAMRSYLRLARMMPAVEGGHIVLEPLLADLFRGGDRRLLIAGAADTGSLALAARAGIGQNPAITVIDRCATPIELCRRFAHDRSLSVELVQDDLTNLALDGQFDIVLAHLLLAFIEPKRRIDVLQRMGKSLRPGGRLLLLFQVVRATGARAALAPADYARTALDALDAVEARLPISRQAFEERLRAYAQWWLDHTQGYGGARDVEKLLKDAGFKVDDWISFPALVTKDFEADPQRKLNLFLAVARLR